MRPATARHPSLAVCVPARARNESGNLSTYIAAALVLPLLILLASAGVSLSSLVSRAAVVSSAESAGLMAAEIQGGVTSAVTHLVLSDLQAEGGSGGTLSVSGTPPTAPWGTPIEIDVTDTTVLTGFPWNLIGLGGVAVQLGGPMYGTSNASP